jgi:hypothetical protein
MVTEREKMPFEITPFILYLTRDKISPEQQATTPPTNTAGSTDNRTSGVTVDSARQAQ